MPVYSNTMPEGPIAPLIVPDLFSETAIVTKNIRPEVDEYVLAIRRDNPSFTRDLLNSMINILVFLKSDKSKLTHKERIEIFSKLFDVSENEAKIIYKMLKLFYRFQNIKKRFASILYA